MTDVSSSGPDPLYELRNAFYLGDFQNAISQAYSTPTATPQQADERDALVYRAHVALKNHQLVLDEVQAGASAGLQAVRALALSAAGQKERALEVARSLITDVMARANPAVQSTCAAIFLSENLFDEALRALAGGQSLEGSAQRIAVYLRLNRVDLATRELKSMQGRDDLAPITLLASVWVDLAQLSGKAGDAVTTTQDLMEKFSRTPLLLNLQAVARMRQGQFEDAERLLNEALSRAPGDPDTLANLVACGLQLRRPSDAVARLQSQLRSSAPSHPWARAVASLDEAFARAAVAAGARE